MFPQVGAIFIASVERWIEPEIVPGSSTDLFFFFVCSPVDAGHLGSGSWVTVCGRGSGRWATVVPVGGRHSGLVHARALVLALLRWSRDRGEGPGVLVELGVVEQRYGAVLEVLEGASVTEVARRNGVARQTVHEWLRRYAERGGLGGLADRSSRPVSCPHQMPAVVEARVVAMRRAHPGWGPARIRWQLAGTGSSRCRGGRRCIGRWCATGWSRRPNAGGGGRTTGGGSGAGRWSCGRWT